MLLLCIKDITYAYLYCLCVIIWIISNNFVRILSIQYINKEKLRSFIKKERARATWNTAEVQEIDVAGYKEKG